LGTNLPDQREIRAPREAIRTGPTRYRRVLRSGLTVELADLPATMTLADLAGVARQLSDRVMSDFVAAEAARGRRARCQRRCDACCHYAVGLGVCEAAALADWIRALPTRPQAVLRQRLTDAAGPVAAALGRGGDCPEALPTREAMALMADLPPRPCAFLHQGLCSIYLQRPLACREHVALIGQRPCRRWGGAAAEVETSVLQATVRAAARIEGRAAEIVPLPLVLAWAGRFADRLARTYCSKAMLDALLDELEAQLPADWVSED
jgi:Fe-S-cluster containining protein